MIINALNFVWSDPKYHHPTRIRKVDKNFERTNLILNTKFPMKIRDIHKIEKRKNSISVNVFGYEKKVIYLIYASKKFFEKKHVDLLLIEEESKRQ